MHSIHYWKWPLALLLLLIGGCIRLPLETSFSKELTNHRLSEAPLNLSLREDLGQSTFIAVLGGFRSLVASVIEIQSMEAWYQQNYAKVDAAFALCTRLQPRVYHYWDWRAWMSSHMAYDYHTYEEMSRPGLHPWIRQNLINHAISVLQEGMIHLPQDYRLPRSIAMLKADIDKNQQANYYEASEWFLKAWQLRPSLRYLWRMHVYNLARAPGHELSAWPLLLQMYETGPAKNSDRTPTGITLLTEIYPAVKAQLPDAQLPPEVAGMLDEIRAKTRLRNEREAQRRQREKEELEKLEKSALERLR